jgi:hypothetical protein
MYVVRIEHTVPDFERWKRAFDNAPADRKNSGVRRYRILRSHQDPNYVMIDLEFDRLPEAEAFLSSLERIWEGPGKTVMQDPHARIGESVEVREI